MNEDQRSGSNEDNAPILKNPACQIIELIDSEKDFIGVENILLDANPKIKSDYTLQEKIWRLFEDPSSSRYAQILAIWVMFLIFVSCICFIVETDLAYHMKDNTFFNIIEAFCIYNFTVEYLVRLGTCPNRTDFLWNFLNTIDLLSIAPYYLTLSGAVDQNGAFLRVLRLARVFRVFKISRYVSWIVIFVNAIYYSLQPMGMLLYVIVIAVVFFSSLLYFLERGTWNPEAGYYEREFPLSGEIKISPFQSIPETFWWCIITMTTVGYGDVVPITWPGKLLSGVTSLCGILVFAVPITVISKAFDAELTKMKAIEKIGMENLRSIKTKLISAYRQGEKRKSVFLDDKGFTEEKRGDVLLELVRFLHKQTDEFDWTKLNNTSADDLRSILSYYVRCQIEKSIDNSNKSLLKEIKSAVQNHKDELQNELSAILSELPSKESFQRHAKFDKNMTNILQEDLISKMDRCESRGPSALILDSKGESDSC